MSTPPKPFDGYSYDGRLLLQMLSHLPLADLYSTRRVCTKWWLTIVQDAELRQHMFINPIPQDALPMKEWYQLFSPYDSIFHWRDRAVEQLRHRPFVMNPVVHRQWTLLSAAAPRDEGSLGTFSFEVSPFAISRRTVHPDEHSAAYRLPLEDPLDAEDSKIVMFPDCIAVGGPRFPTADDVRLRDRHGWRTAREYGTRSPNARLKDIKDRDFVDPVQIYSMPAAMLCEQDAFGHDVFPVESWTWMLLTQPPVDMIALKHPTMPVAWRVQALNVVRVIYVLQVCVSKPPPWKE